MNPSVAPFLPQFGSGAPGANVPVNQLYFDVTSGSYVPYVYNGGAWRLFDGGAGPFLPIAGGTLTGALGIADGSAGSPSFKFGSHSTGWFWDTTNNGWGLSFSGVQNYFMNANTFSLSVPGGVSSAIIQMQAEAGTAVNNERYSNNAGAPSSQLRKARGTIASPAVPQINDQLGIYRYQGWVTGTTFTTGAELRTVLIETGTVSATAMGSSYRVFICPIGSGTLTEVSRQETATGLSMFGANVVIDQNRVFRLRNFTVATLPAANLATGQLTFVTDATLTAITGLGTAVIGGGANKVPVYSDGTNWIII